MWVIFVFLVYLKGIKLIQTETGSSLKTFFVSMMLFWWLFGCLLVCFPERRPERFITTGSVQNSNRHETLLFKYDKNQIAKITHDVKSVIVKRDHTN